MTPLAIYAQSPWDKYTLPQGLQTINPWQQWMRFRPELVIGWDPAQKPNIGIYRNLAIYIDAYAIYNSSEVATTHPDWILHDDAGNPLYIPYGCSGGKCPQFAGDLTNPAFVNYQMMRIQSLFAAKYQGVFLDDVNLQLTLGDGNGQAVVPAGITEDSWAWAFVRFLEAVRSDFPRFIICHNSVWFAQAPTEAVNRQIAASTYCVFERGYGDPNLTQYQMMRQLRAVDRVHQLGRSVIQREYSKDNLQFKKDAFDLGYKPGDLMIVDDLFPDDTSGAWAVLDA